MTKIECTECHDIIETSARTVELPFVCGGCKQDIADCNTMAPQTEYRVPNHVGQAVVLQQGQVAYCEGGDSGQELNPATIENTTLLIEDLQLQLQNAREVATMQSEVIAEDSGKLADYEQLKADYQKLFETNQVNIERAVQLNDHVTLLMVRKQELGNAVAALVGQVFSLTFANAELQKQVRLRDIAGMEVVSELIEQIAKNVSLETSCDQLAGALVNISGRLAKSKKDTEFLAARGTVATGKTARVQHGRNSRKRSTRP